MATDRRWRLPAPVAATLLVEIAAIELWAGHATDPDFYLPDPFRALVVLLVAAAAGAGFLRGAARTVALTAIFALPAAILLCEWRGAGPRARAPPPRLVTGHAALPRPPYRPRPPHPDPPPAGA